MEESTVCVYYDKDILLRELTTMNRDIDNMYQKIKPLSSKLICDSKSKDILRNEISALNDVYGATVYIITHYIKIGDIDCNKVHMKLNIFREQLSNLNMHYEKIRAELLLKDGRNIIKDLI